MGGGGMGGGGMGMRREMPAAFSGGGRYGDRDGGAIGYSNPTPTNGTAVGSSNPNSVSTLDCSTHR
jgi:hypothetical protein